MWKILAFLAMHDNAALPSMWEPSLVDQTMTFSNPAPQHLTISGKDGVIADLNMDTGDAVLTGDPNEAARVFWDAVKHNLPTCKNSEEVK